MSRILAIDPGTEKSGFVVWDRGVIEASEVSNEEMLARIITNDFGGLDICALEMVQSYGMSVGRETFETVFWTGRMFERAQRNCTAIRIYRKDVKIHLCGTMRAKDKNIRQALLDKYGPVGTSKNKGPLHGISGHLWSALAIASYVDNTTPTEVPDPVLI